MKIAMYSAMTRPRSSGAVVSCTRVLAAVIRVCVATPAGISASANSR